MSLLTLLGGPAPPEPPSRSRWWLGQLWRYAPRRHYTPAQADQLVAVNWGRSAKAFKRDGVIDPEAAP